MRWGRGEGIREERQGGNKFQEGGGLNWMSDWSRGVKPERRLSDNQARAGVPSEQHGPDEPHPSQAALSQHKVHDNPQTAGRPGRNDPRQRNGGAGSESIESTRHAYAPLYLLQHPENFGWQLVVTTLGILPKGPAKGVGHGSGRSQGEREQDLGGDSYAAAPAGSITTTF